MWLPIRMLPDEVMEKYLLHNLIVNSRIHNNITLGKYILPQTVQIAYNKLVKHLAPFGCHTVKRTRILWKHESCLVTFCLIVDDFGVRYVSCKHAEHLANAVTTNNNITCGW